MKKRSITFFAMFLIIAVSSQAIAQDGDEVDQRLGQILEQYVNTKDGMVHNRDDLSAAWAERLETSIATTPNDVFHEDDLAEWQGYQAVMLDAAGDIVDAENLDEQREALGRLSKELKSVIEYFGNAGSTVYVFRCAEYEDGEQIWLDNKNRVANPYHGPQNIDCGEMIEEL